MAGRTVAHLVFAFSFVELEARFRNAPFELGLLQFLRDSDTSSLYR